jgi:predicted nucleic acid-binding protein
LVTSEAVIDEFQVGTFPNKDQALALLADIRLVPVAPAIIEIVETDIQRMVMPRDPTGDALHLALASYHKCDYLLTWNVQHLANANKFAHIRRVNALMGVFTPALVTPSNSSHRRDTMQDDPAIARIREVRHRISKQFDHKPKRLVEYYI